MFIVQVYAHPGSNAKTGPMSQLTEYIKTNTLQGAAHEQYILYVHTSNNYIAHYYDKVKCNLLFYVTALTYLY